MQGRGFFVCDLEAREIVLIFALAKHKRGLALRIGSVAQLNRASDYGSEGYRFESCRSH